MSRIVFFLCAITSLVCALLLLRTYLRQKTPLLFWALLCFVGLTINNIITIVDVFSGPDLNLSAIRLIPAILGVAALLIGMIWATV